MAAPKTEADLLARLKEVTELRNAVLDRAVGLYNEQLALCEAGRAMDPPVRLGEMAKASGVSEVSIINALKRKAEGALTTTRDGQARAASTRAGRKAKA